MDWQKLAPWAGAAATLLSGMATLGAVLFALNLQRRMERRSKPSLVVEYDPSLEGDNRYLPPSATDYGGPGPNRQEVWIRVRITNKSSNPAKDVELRFISSQITTERTRNNRPCWWFKVSNLNSVAITIPPRFPQYFDIAYIVQDVATKEAKAFLVITQPSMLEWNQEKARIEAYGDYTKLEIGWPYNIFFAVVGSNCDAAYYKMPIQFSPPRQDGKKIRECITVGVPVVISAEQAFSE
jgi:hypothetical protein